MHTRLPEIGTRTTGALIRTVRIGVLLQMKATDLPNLALRLTTIGMIGPCRHLMAPITEPKEAVAETVEALR